VSRQADPDVLFAARRGATIERLLTYAQMRERAEAWCDAWEAYATARGIPRTDEDYWDRGETWMIEHRVARSNGRFST